MTSYELQLLYADLGYVKARFAPGVSSSQVGGKLPLGSYSTPKGWKHEQDNTARVSV